MRFFPGLHQISDAWRFSRCFISVNRLRASPKRAARKSDFEVNDWIMDSAAFTEISTHGRYRHGVEEYAREIERWSKCGNLLCAVSQDWMCEDAVIEGCPNLCRPHGYKPCGKGCFYGTLLDIPTHQALTVERYQALKRIASAPIMPVLQGYTPNDYLRCLALYGSDLPLRAWVGVGSVCKRNSSPREIVRVLSAIKAKRPDLRLHGFGIKTTALGDERVWRLLHSSDSIAWSQAARIARHHGDLTRSGNDWREAKRFERKIKALHEKKDEK